MSYHPEASVIARSEYPPEKIGSTVTGIPGRPRPVTPSRTYPCTPLDRGGRYRSTVDVPGPQTYVVVEIGACPGASPETSTFPVGDCREYTPAPSEVTDGR